MSILVSTLLFAEDNSSDSPFYGYISFTSGYVANFSNQADSYDHFIPLGLQYGFMEFESTNRFALGFGHRVDLEYGIISDKAENGSFSIETLAGLNGYIKINRHLALDLLVGVALGVIDTSAKNFFTIGPGMAASLRIYPGITGFSFDVGIATYGHFSFGGNYMGASVVPFAGFTFDMNSLIGALALAPLLLWW